MSFFNTIKEYIDSKFEEKYKIIETTQNILIENQNKSNDELNFKINDIFEENKKLLKKIDYLYSINSYYPFGINTDSFYPCNINIDTRVLYILKLFNSFDYQHYGNRMVDVILINVDINVLKHLKNIKCIRILHDCDLLDYSNNAYLRYLIFKTNYFNESTNNFVQEYIDLVSLSKIFNYHIINQNYTISSDDYSICQNLYTFLKNCGTDFHNASVNERGKCRFKLNNNYLQIRDKSNTFQEYINNLKIAFEI